MKEQLSRLGIFVFYDSEGIVDDYIPYLLRDIKKTLTRLVVIVNGILTPEGRRCLEEYGDNLLVRENSGFDFSAWKYAMADLLGWETVKQYDELVLFNDTFFGPFRPFEEIFETMAHKQVDFWGLCAHGEIRDFNPFGRCPYGYLPTHIQSFFLVVRHAMLQGDLFKEFWENRPASSCYEEAVAVYECVFTKYFSDAGFTWDTYIDCSDMDAFAPTAHSVFSPGALLTRGMPVLKIKSFALPLQSYLNITMGEDLAVGLQYIREHTPYDEGMIFRHILRKFNVADIHNTLHLDYVLPVRVTARPTGGGDPRALVVLHLYYMDLLPSEEIYIRSIPDCMDVLVTTVSEEKKTIIEQALSSILGARLHVVVMQNRGREAAALLVAARPFLSGYEYVCFCQDKKSSQVMYATGQSFARLGWENMLPSREYVWNVVETFEKEPFLGLLAPPRFFGGLFAANMSTGLWTICYNGTVELAKRLGLKANLSPEKEIIALDTIFWARTKALKPLLDYEWAYEDFPAEPSPIDGTMRHIVERILQFVAQDRGYYTGTVMTPEYASMIVNDCFYHMIHTPVQSNAGGGVPCVPETGMKRKLKNILKRRLPPRVWSFCKKLYYRLGGKPI